MKCVELDAKSSPAWRGVLAVRWKHREAIPRPPPPLAGEGWGEGNGWVSLWGGNSPCPLGVLNGKGGIEERKVIKKCANLNRDGQFARSSASSPTGCYLSVKCDA